MLRTNGANARADLFGAGKPGYSSNADLANVDPTSITPETQNAIQEEFCAPIEEVGLVVDGTDNHQLLKAINMLAGKGVITVSATCALTAAQRGTVLVDATAEDVWITLPAADRFMDFTFERIDGTTNVVAIQCAGAGKIFHNIWVNPAGYAFIKLFGAGDMWSIRSTAAGAWLVGARRDSTPIGSVIMSSSGLVPAGGYIPANGLLFSRAGYPWLWDFAASAAGLQTEVAWAASGWGGYSIGDGVTNFRAPQLCGEFIRIWDDSRGVDAGRGIGSAQAGDVAPLSAHIPGAAGGGGVGAVIGAGNSASLPVIFGTGGTETRPRNVALAAFLKVI